MTSETFEPPLVELRSDESLRIWNMVLKNDRLKQLGITLKQFLELRWEEAQNNPAVRRFQSLRVEALKEIPRAIDLVFKQIR